MSTTPPVISGVDFVAVPTRNYAAAAAFYGTVLGLPCSAVYDRVPGGEFETGSLTLQVIDAEAIGREFVPHRFPIALHVEDIEAAGEERAACPSRTRSTPASATWRSSRTRTATP